MDIGKVCAIVSAVKCVNLAIHRPVPLGIKIHYMFIKIKKFKKKLIFSRITKTFSKFILWQKHSRNLYLIYLFIYFINI